MAFYVADFAIVTGRLLYILTHSRMTYSAMIMKTDMMPGATGIQNEN